MWKLQRREIKYQSEQKKKEIWKIVNSDISKSCQQGNSTYIPSTIWNSFPFFITNMMSSYSYWFKRLFLHYTFTRKGQKKFVFTVPTYNNSQTKRRYQSTVLPQGMLNSPTLCQYFISKPLEIIRIHSSVEGHLGCFLVLAYMNINAAMNIVEYISLWYDWATFVYTKQWYC